MTQEKQNEFYEQLEQFEDLLTYWRLIDLLFYKGV